MAHPGFGHLWQQADMSDIDIVLLAAGKTAPAGDDAVETHPNPPTVLSQFPGHSQIISLSPHFVAQVLRWSAKPQQDGPSEPGSSSSDTAGSSDQQQAKRLRSTRQLQITLPDASYEQAALAVLAGLYAVKPCSELLADLSHQQQVQAAVLADMWQLPAARDAALQLLKAAIGSADGVPPVLEQLLSMPAVPDCLQLLLEQALLSRFGDLEAVWRARGRRMKALQRSLLALPLPAMELLLASDKLKVASEDTVLFTARLYAGVVEFGGAGREPDSAAAQLARERLAPLVRWPHVSQFWLSTVFSEDASNTQLWGLRPQLQRLLALELAGSTAGSPSAEEIEEHVPDAPASWLLPVRDIKPVSSAVLEWELGINAIKQTAQDSASRQQDTVLRSPASRLLHGIRLALELQCFWQEGESGSTVGVFIVPYDLPEGVMCRCTCSIECVGFVEPVFLKRDCMVPLGRGFEDLFDTGPMSGGFDEAAWTAQGLPTAGSIVLRATVQDVGV